MRLAFQDFFVLVGGDLLGSRGYKGLSGVGCVTDDSKLSDANPLFAKIRYIGTSTRFETFKLC